MKYIAVLGVLVVGTAHAADPFACVDSDVADALLSDPHRGRASYSTAIPDGFGELSIPAGFELMGSRADHSRSSVVFKTSQPKTQALSMATETLTEAGWTERKLPHRRGSGGFQVGPQTSNAWLCRDDKSGALSLVATETSRKVFVTFSKYRSSNVCDDSDPAAMRHDPRDIIRLLPTLTIPDSATATEAGTSGSGRQVSAHVGVRGATSRADLMNYLEDQIRNQKWKHQTSWSSDFSSGSVWVLNTDEKGLLVGTLHLSDAGVDPIAVRFDVIPSDPSKVSDRGSWSSSTH